MLHGSGDKVVRWVVGSVDKMLWTGKKIPQ